MNDELEESIEKYNLIQKESNAKISSLELKDGYVTFFKKIG